MRDALHSEWVKLRTLPTAGWLLLSTVVLTVGLGAAIAAAQSAGNTTTSLDATKISLSGLYLGQAVVVVLAVLMFSAEYGCGLMSVTVAATPRRHLVLIAKAVYSVLLALIAGAVAVVVSVLVGSFLLTGNGLTAAHGYEIASLSGATNLRAVGGTVLYLALIALLSMGIAAIVREAAAAIAAVLALLYVFPILAALVDPTWSRHVNQIGPMTAGLAIEATRNLQGMPLSPWAGLGVLALWAFGAWAVGGLMFRLRDV
jgi:ABC-2 type transport system permease protein